MLLFGYGDMTTAKEEGYNFIKRNLMWL